MIIHKKGVKGLTHIGDEHAVMLARIERACRDNNHGSVRQCLETIESSDVMRQVLLRIIEYYESEEERFPVGYVILYIKWLLKNRDYDEAGRQIEKLKVAGIEGERVSELIYEYAIKPAEPEFEERFNRNLEMLTRNRVLFSRHSFDFHDIKKKVITIGNYQSYPEEYDYILEQEKTSFLIVDLTDMEKIRQILDRGNLLYLVYDDLNRFSHMLLFEDLQLIRKHIEALATDEAENVIFFAGRDMDNIREFFGNMLTVIPHYAIRPGHQDYQEVMTEIFEQRRCRFLSCEEELKAYYKEKDSAYYQDLFSGEPGDIKILVIATLNSTLNQHIARSWQQSFASLGYDTEFLIENEQYERAQQFYITERMCGYKPDIVFIINFPVNRISGEKDIKDNLLWIMRYRDHNEMNHGAYTYDNENMFVLPFWWEFNDVLRERSVPEKRICYTVEGVDVHVFKKREDIGSRYACDIVSVNNSVGNEESRLQYYLAMLDNDLLKSAMEELYVHMREMAIHDDFLEEDVFLELLYEKSREKGLEIKGADRQFFLWFYFTVADSFYRSRVMHWILDSGITKDINVWGGSWSNIQRFKDYHMGIARHGEQLSEIYQSSRISLSESWTWNTHERNFEIMASGGFPLIRHIKVPDDKKMDVITNYFREDEEVVLFYGRDDLLNKIQYYLDHPGERDRIAEKGRDITVRRFSNSAIAKKTMDFIRDYYTEMVHENGGKGEEKERVRGNAS